MTEERRFSESDLSAFIMGEGTPDERRTIEKAIASSPELRRTYHSLLNTWDLLDAYRIPEPPAEGLTDLRRRLKVQPMPERKPARAGSFRLWRVAALAAGLAIAVGIPVLIRGGGPAGPGSRIVRVATPVGPAMAATPTGRPVTAQLASIPVRTGAARRFLAGSDGNLQAGVTVTADSLAEWDQPAIRVDHLDDLPALNLEDYTISNYEFEGGAHPSAQPDAIPVSTDPM